MQDKNMGTAMVTPASASVYCSARLPKRCRRGGKVYEDDTAEGEEMGLLGTRMQKGRKRVTEDNDAGREHGHRDGEAGQRQRVLLCEVAKKMQKGGKGLRGRHRRREGNGFTEVENAEGEEEGHRGQRCRTRTWAPRW